MSSQVKKKAAEIDDLIRRNAAEAKADADKPSATDSPDQDVSSDEPEQTTAEVVSIEPTAQEQAPDDTATPDIASIQQQLSEAQRRADQADQRWRSLDGQLRSKDEQIDRLTDLVAKMTEAPRSAPEPEAPRGFTSADAETFGDDMIDLVQRIARQVVDTSIADLKQTLDGLTTEVKDVSQHTAVAVQDSFQTKLTALAPKWGQYDRDERFHNWLAESPTRQSMFSEGAKNKDAQLVAEFFNMFIQKAEAAEATSTAATGKKASKLEAQIAPGKSRSTPTAASTVPTDKKQWTRTEIATVYNNKKRGVYSKEEWAVLEAEVVAAQKQDRVDYSR